MSLIDKAKEYLKAGLSVMPTKEDKRPVLVTWKPYQATRLKEEEVDKLFIGENVKGLGIICGAISGGLEVIDVDTKHDTTGSLWEDLRTLIEDNLPETYNRLVIAQTKSGGYHLYYRCSSIAGNLKLSTKLNREVLIETRGEGGYVVAPPAPGYTYIKGDPGNIPTITPEEREVLFSIAKSFTEIAEPEPKVKTETTYQATGLSPFEDYNHRGDVVTLLEAKGWRTVNQSGQRINLLRPGQTDSKSSGNFHTGLKVLRVFSSSTEFNPDKGYSPAQVFSLLECNGDNKVTYRKLLELGYGEPYNGQATQLKTEWIKVEAVNRVNRESSVISEAGDSLQIEKITGEEVVITSPGPEATDEVITAITLIEPKVKRVYVREGAEPEVRSYQYRLQALIKKYNQSENTQRDIDKLLDEVVLISSKLEPVDKDILKKDFLSLGGIAELGISKESLDITEEKLTSTRDKEDQAKEFKKLLSQATDFQNKGEIDKALELLEDKLKEVKIIVGKELLPPPLSYTTLLEEIATIPPAYKTGYSSLDKFVGFTPGSISLIAGRPSHGKTTLLFNLLLQMSNLYKDEIFYFFTYEEPVKNISIKLLNRLTATDLSGYIREVTDLPKPTNYEYLKAYIRARRTDIKEIEEGKRKLQDLIDSQRIRIIGENYSVEQLYSLIAYVNKKDKLGGVFIDYIQRMRTERRTQDKRTEIAHISDQVLQIAKDSGLPIILGAQLNRATVNSGNKKPSLENLKEAGNLEEDANTVLSVYNDSREKGENAEGDSYTEAREVELEIKALKNREGEPNKTATLIFDKWTGVIKDQESKRDYFKPTPTAIKKPEKPKTKKQITEEEATVIVREIKRILQEELHTELKPLTEQTILNYLERKNTRSELIVEVIKQLKPELTLSKMRDKKKTKK